MTGKAKKASVSAGDNSVVIGGDVTSSNIVIGNSNTVSNSTIKLSVLFNDIYKKLEAEKNIKPQEKEDIKAELKDVQAELEKPKPDETFLARRFRNVKRMAPDIADIALETLKNPISGVVEIIKKVSKKVAEEAGTK